MDTKTAMSPQESVKIIQEMITTARFNFSRGSVYFILWGALLPAAAVFEFLANRVGFELSYIGWPIVGLIGAVYSMIYGYRSEKNGGNTPLDKIYASIWITYFITLILLITSLVYSNINPGPYIMLLTGLPTFLTGLCLAFNPLKIGGVIFWLAGLAGIFFNSEYFSLIFAAAIILGYMVPGILMRRITK